ncbi:MAG: methionine synthase [Haloferacaceae archaeon]
MTREQFRPPDREPENFLLTTVVGSYPRPAWLPEIEDAHAAGDVPEEVLAEALDDASRAAVNLQDRLGLDVVTDGEVRREGMVEYFARYIDNVERDGGGDGTGWNTGMPTVVDRVSSAEPWLVDDFSFAATVTDRPVKVTVTGPFTLASFSQPQAYDDVGQLATDFADLVAEEVARLVDAGARWIQIDEPGLGVSPHGELAHECLSRIAEEVPPEVRLGVHVCSGNYADLVPDLFSFPVDEVDLEFASENADDPAEVLADHDGSVDVGFGVVDPQRRSVESVEEIQAGIEEALSLLPPEQLTITPDCGLKPVERPVAREKLENMVAAVEAVEASLADGDLETV